MTLVVLETVVSTGMVTALMMTSVTQTGGVETVTVLWFMKMLSLTVTVVLLTVKDHQM